ncbi:AAA-like domain-containing protein [Desulfococcaceae bacterium HSG7]|nr:AAA-like domain-containing protein [Desulfococcaceae bacterium HSG7]
MVHFAYPNAVFKEFLGCGRFEASLQGKYPGIEPVTPDTPGIAEVQAAASRFAPESPGVEIAVYEIKDRTDKIYQGASLELAYMLALINCSRPLDIDRHKNCSDIWCTGSINIKGDTLPFLKEVDFQSFDIKLDAFLSENNADNLFVIPAGNVQQKHKIRFKNENINSLMLNHVRDRRLTLQDLFNKKTVLMIHGDELESLVNLIFTPPRFAEPVPDASPDTRNASKRLRVALIYKRRAQPDERLLRVLEEHLTEAGHRVFIDRHIKIGDEWEKQITYELRTADAVVILLSSIAVYSEMLAYEVEIAFQTARENNGRPRLFPIRICFKDPLPQELANKLASLQYIHWRTPDDDMPLVAELSERLKNPSQASRKPLALEMVGGSVPLDSKFYITRPADDEFQTAIARRDSVVLIKGARQVGKTSLLARGLQSARDAGVQVVLTDFQKFIDAQLQSLESFFFAVGEMLADQLGVDAHPADDWRSRSAPNVNFERFFRRHILGHSHKPLLWAMDEADRLFHCSFGSEIFAMFRTWHNERSLNPGGPCSQLTLAIAYATESYLFIEDQNQSPFNVGTKLGLEDFTSEQVADLNERHGSPLRNDELHKFYKLAGGQPYLVRRGLNDMVSQNMGFDQFIDGADHDDGAFGDHLRRMLLMLNREPHLGEIVSRVLQRQPCPDYDSFYRLRSAGILRGASKDDVAPRCELYSSYLRKHLKQSPPKQRFITKLRRFLKR